MANVQVPPLQRPARRPTSLVRCVAIILLTLIVLIGLAILITWLVIRPKKIIYTIEDGWVQNFALNNNHLNSTFDFVLRAHNPNHRVAIYYDKIETSVIYEDQTIGFNNLQPFLQPCRNVTRLPVELVARNAAVGPTVVRALKVSKAMREVALDVNAKARIRFKVGRWKSAHRTVKIYCSQVIMHFSTTKQFESKKCDVDM